MTEDARLPCVLPWKALFTDEWKGNVVALPCCRTWINRDYGILPAGCSMMDAWNSEQAQEIRRLLAEGRQAEVCSPDCPELASGRFSEERLRVLSGPMEYTSNQALSNREIRERAYRLSSRPMLLKFTPTTRCNLRCSMCFQRRGGTPGLSRIEDWSIVEDLQPYAAEITLQGGEITLLPQFRRFLARAARPEFSHTKVSIITNGTIWDQELSRLFGEVRVGFIVVSLNAAKAETFHAITGVDSFHTVTANVENVLKLSRTHKYTNFDVILSFVVMRSNFEELPAFLDLSSRLGTQAQVSPVDPDGSSEDPWCDHATHGRMRAVLDRASLLAAPKTLSQIQSIVKLLLRCPMCGRA